MKPLAEVVEQRTREIGLRMAPGAREREVLALVLRQGMVPARLEGRFSSSLSAPR